MHNAVAITAKAITSGCKDKYPVNAFFMNVLRIKGSSWNKYTPNDTGAKIRINLVSIFPQFKFIKKNSKNTEQSTIVGDVYFIR